jgi:predicted nucleotidyltransferase
MNLETIRTKYRQQILGIAAKYKAENVRIFGSVVRGEETEKSDVDFLVHFKKGASLFDEAGLSLDLEELLGCKVDLLSDRVLRPEFKEFIFNEARPL